jgi:hypothetical protein
VSKRVKLSLLTLACAGVWTWLLFNIASSFHIFVSDDPFDEGANIAARTGSTVLVLVWLAGVLAAAAAIVYVWLKSDT